MQASLGRFLWENGDAIAALAACREAVRLVPADPPSVARARVAAGLGQILMIMAHGDEGVEYCQEAVRIASQTGARAIESHALDTLGILTAYDGDVDGGLAMLRRSFEIAQEIGSVEEMGRATGNITDVLIFAAGRYDEAGDLGIEAIGPVDAPTMTGVAAAIQSADVVLARYLAGRWDEAASALMRAHLQPASGAGEIALGIRSAQLAVGRGDFDVASSLIAGLNRQLEDADDMQWIAPLAAAQAELAIWQSDPAAALRDIEHALSRVHLSVGANASRIGPLLALGIRAAADLEEMHRRHRRAADADAARAQGAEHLAAMRTDRDEVAARGRRLSTWRSAIWLSARPRRAGWTAMATRMPGRRQRGPLSCCRSPTRARMRGSGRAKPSSQPIVAHNAQARHSARHTRPRSRSVQRHCWAPWRPWRGAAASSWRRLSQRPARQAASLRSQRESGRSLASWRVG